MTDGTSCRGLEVTVMVPEPSGREREQNREREERRQPFTAEEAGLLKQQAAQPSSPKNVPLGPDRIKPFSKNRSLRLQRTLNRPVWASLNPKQAYYNGPNYSQQIPQNGWHTRQET
jgi:hypothetical protein